MISNGSFDFRNVKSEIKEKIRELEPLNWTPPARYDVWDIIDFLKGIKFMNNPPDIHMEEMEWTTNRGTNRYDSDFFNALVFLKNGCPLIIFMDEYDNKEIYRYNSNTDKFEEFTTDEEFLEAMKQ